MSHLHCMRPVAGIVRGILLFGAVCAVSAAAHADPTVGASSSASAPSPPTSASTPPTPILPISTTPAATEPVETASAPLAPSTQQGSSTATTLSYVGLSLAAVGLVVGSVTGVVSLSKTSTLKDDCGGTVCPRNKQDDIDSAKRYAGISNISFGLAFVGAWVGITGLILGGSSSSTDTAKTKVEPRIGLGSVGLEGRF